MIVVYHRCPTFACGSIDTTIRWWAIPEGGAWTFMFYGANSRGGQGLAHRDALKQRIVAALGATPMQAAAAAQDARAESPDL